MAKKQNKLELLGCFLLHPILVIHNAKIYKGFISLASAAQEFYIDTSLENRDVSQLQAYSGALV